MRRRVCARPRAMCGRTFACVCEIHFSKNVTFFGKLAYELPKRILILKKIRWFFLDFLKNFWLDDSLWQVHLRGSNIHSKFYYTIKLNYSKFELWWKINKICNSALCDLTFAHFWNKIARKCYSRKLFPVLEHPFLL